MDLNEASKLLGLSTKSIRGYIKRGEIEARKVEGKTGRAWKDKQGCF
jgi:predicted site-specific integrase-resolvase